MARHHRYEWGYYVPHCLAIRIQIDSRFYPGHLMNVIENIHTRTHIHTHIHTHTHTHTHIHTHNFIEIDVLIFSTNMQGISYKMIKYTEKQIIKLTNSIIC